MFAPAVDPLLGVAFVIPMGAGLAWCAAVGGLIVYRVTVGALLLWLAKQIDEISFGRGPFTATPGEAIASRIRELDAAIKRTVGGWAKASEALIAAFWDELAETWNRETKFWQDFAATVEGAFTRVYRTTIPAVRREAFAQADRAAARWRAQVAQLTTVVIPALSGRIGAAGGRLDRLRDAANWLRGKVRRHDKLLTGAGITGLVAIALRRLGLGWLRNGKFRKWGKRLRDMDPRVLDALLLGTFLLSGPVDIEKWARELAGQADIVEGAMRKGFKLPDGWPG